MRFPVFSSCLQPPNWTNFRTKILVQKRFFSKWFFRHGLYAAKRCVFNGFKPLIRLEIRHGTLLVYKFFLQTVRKIVHERKKPLRAVCGPPVAVRAGRMPGYPAARRSRCRRTGRTVGPPGPSEAGRMPGYPAGRRSRCGPSVALLWPSEPGGCRDTRRRGGAAVGAQGAP